MKIRVLILVVFSLVLPREINAQQMPIYTNYLFNAYAFNPAVAGSTPFVSAMMNYRDQWVGFDGAPRTFMASMYGPFKKSKKVALGGMISTDITGLLQRTSVYFTYAYHVQLNSKWKLGLGLSGGAMQYRVSLYNAKLYDKEDQVLNGNLLTSGVFDANAGLYLYSSKFFFGLSGYQMANNSINIPGSESNLSPQFYAMSGYTFKINKNFDLQPSCLLKYNSPVPLQPEFSLRAIYKKLFWIGGSMRMNEAFCFMLGCVCYERFNIAYAYDFPYMGLMKYNTGSHEIMLRYNFVKTKKQINKDEEEFNEIDNSFKSNLKNKKKSPENTEQKKDEE